MPKHVSKYDKAERAYIRKERELDAMGWIRRECGRWVDPLTGECHATGVAYDIAYTRRTQKKRK